MLPISTHKCLYFITIPAVLKFQIILRDPYTSGMYHKKQNRALNTFVFIHICIIQHHHYILSVGGSLNSKDRRIIADNVLLQHNCLCCKMAKTSGLKRVLLSSYPDFLAHIPTLVCLALATYTISITLDNQPVNVLLYCVVEAYLH